MKKSVLYLAVLLCLGLTKLPAQTTHQSGDTLWIDSYALGDINTVIAGDTLPDGTAAYPNRIYGLHKGYIYLLNGSIVTNKHRVVRLYGEIPGNDPSTSMAMIQPGYVSGVYYTSNFNCYGSIIATNVWFSYEDNTGAQSWIQMTFNNDSTYCRFDNCIFDLDQAPTIITNGHHFNSWFTNCIIRNCVDPSQWWGGRSIYYNVNVATGDTCYSENCSYYNVGFGIQTQGQYIGYAYYNHNTFLNVSKFAIQESYWYHAYVTNNLFVNCHYTGERYADRAGQDLDNQLYGVLNIDTCNRAIDVTNGTTENKRILVIANNANYREPWFDTFYAAYNDTVPITAPDYGQRIILPEPWMNDRSAAFFDKSLYTLGGNCKSVNNLIDDDNTGIYNPQFQVEPTNYDSIWSFLKARYGAGGNVNWMYKPDYQALVWPFTENLAYANDTLAKGGYFSFPIGDLRWFPTQKASWSSENDLTHTGGIVTSVKGTQTVIPNKYSLGQNYPNPFNPTTQIKYSLSTMGTVNLKVFNILGQEVETLISGMQSAGDHAVTFDGSKFASGVYFYSLQAGNQLLVKKMVMMK